MPGKQLDRKTILTQSNPNSHHEYRVDTFTVNPWWHVARARDWVIRNGKEADISRLQSARARLRWHGTGYARIGQRNRHACQLFQQHPDWTDAHVARRLNGAHGWRLSPISRRQVCNIRHQHTDCAGPCVRTDLLETTANPGSVHPAIGIDGPTLAMQQVADPSIPILDRDCHRYVWRTIPTRYGAFTYLHDVQRWPLKPPQI